MSNKQPIITLLICYIKHNNTVIEAPHIAYVKLIYLVELRLHNLQNQLSSHHLNEQSMADMLANGG